jgi:hypothetical protein
MRIPRRSSSVPAAGPARLGGTIRGLRDFQKELRRAGGPALAKTLAKAHKAISIEVVKRSQRVAQRTYRPSSRISQAITARGSQRKASIALSPFKDARIFAAEFGYDWQKVGWRRPANRPVIQRHAGTLGYPTFGPWRGNQWQGTSGPGAGVGYAVFPTIRNSTNDILASYLDYIEGAFARAYPERI